ncbi:MAG: hypothetical protein H6810_01940 [Phycisphaeraceae bacterium]|nr:MAG: hypothetical protein H6810_01940 [Phycisphaeraceae bacterium]
MTADPFDTLGLEPAFGLADVQIEQAYLARIASAHPDRDADGAAAAAALNVARAALLSPERRANTLLARLGGPGPSDDKSLPDGFLMEMMTVRGEIEEAIADGGDDARGEWEVWADERRAGFIERVGALFARAQAGETPALAKIRTELNAWRYIERLIEQLDPDYDPARADFGP